MRANLRSTYPGDWAFLLGPMLVAAAPFQGWIEPNTVGILKDDGDLGVNDDDDADSIETEGSVDDADSVDGVNGPTATGSATATAAPVTLSRISETKTRTESTVVISTGTTIETVTVSASTSRTSRPTTTTTLTSSPTQTGDSGDVLYGGPVRGDAPPDLGQPEIGREGAQEEGNYNRNDGSKVPQKMLVAGAVVGSLVFLALVIFVLYRWRKPIIRKFFPGHYSRRLEETLVTGAIIPPAMAERRRTPRFSERFQNAPVSERPRFTLPPLPKAVTIRNSITASQRESYMNFQLVRELVERGDAALEPPASTGRMNSSTNLPGDVPPTYVEAANTRKRLSERLPVGSGRGFTVPSTIRTSDVPVADGFYHPTAGHASQFPYPPPAIPDSPQPLPLLSRFSWTTAPDTAVSRVQSTSARSRAGLGLRASVRTTSSEDTEPPHFRGVHSWVNNQAKRMERQEKLERAAQRANAAAALDSRSQEPTASSATQQQQQQQDSLPTSRGSVGTTRSSSQPETPVAFRHHPGYPVDFGGSRGHARILSEDLDNELNLKMYRDDKD